MHFLVTAGPTREPLDPVRFLSNRSSGKMGYAVASAAQALGHRVTLVSGPVNLAAPAGIELVKVTTAQEMHDAVAARVGEADCAVFTAAVADYRPVAPAEQKIKKTGEHLVLTLERTPDILGSARVGMGFRGVLVGFAAETENLAANAALKLQRKHCDLVVANDVSRPETGFDTDDNEVLLVFADGRREAILRSPKTAIAARIVAECVTMREMQDRNK